MSLTTAKVYFLMAVLFQSLFAEVSGNVYCPEGLGTDRNQQSLLQVKASTMQKQEASIEQNPKTPPPPPSKQLPTPPPSKKSKQLPTPPPSKKSKGNPNQKPASKQQTKGFWSPAIGISASLDQAGYQSVADQCCAEQMIAFMRRVITKQGLYVCDEGALAGLSVWFDCEDDAKSYDELLVAVNASQTGDCPFIGAQPNCPAPPQECGYFPDTTLPACQAPCSRTHFFEFSFDGPVSSNLGGYGPDKTAPEELRFANAGTLNGGQVDLVIVNVSPLNSTDVKDAGAASGGKMGKLSVRGGARVRLKFTFVVSGSNEPVNPPPAELHFSVFDIDSSLNGKMTENVYFDQTCIVREVGAAEFLTAEGADGYEKASSSFPGPSCNNPHDPMKLEVDNVCVHKGITYTTNQRKRSAMAIIKKSSSFKVEFETTCVGTCQDGRIYLFSGTSALNDLCTD